MDADDASVRRRVGARARVVCVSVVVFSVARGVCFGGGVWTPERARDGRNGERLL